MINDMKKAFHDEVHKLLEDLLLEQDKSEFIMKLGIFSTKIDGIREQVSTDHFDPNEFSLQEKIATHLKIDKRLEELEDEDRNNK